MYKYAFILTALCVFAVDASAIKASLVSKRVANPFDVVDGILDCGKDSTKMVSRKMERTTDCIYLPGSEGTIHEVRVTDCNRVPCDVMVGRTYQVEIEFTPGESWSLLLQEDT